jgi:DNA-binding beta-propeller fold protein YncE
MAAYRNLRRTDPVTAVAALAAVMKTALMLLHLLFAFAVASLLLPVSAAEADFLYVGDGADNTVKRFDTATAKDLGKFVTDGSGGLHGPRGLIFTRGRSFTPIQLYVVNQNVSQPFAGEILRYRRSGGQFVGALVPSSDPNAPFAPRGLIRGLLPTVYVADLGDLGDSEDVFLPGRIARFDSLTGRFLGDLDPTPFVFDESNGPRGLVFGPDGLLYASVRNFDPTGGSVLRFDPVTGKLVDVFITDTGGVGRLNRPEGLVFGPDGKLYVTSFRADATDTDSIRIYSRERQFLNKIDLDQVGEPRAFAQALLFGPGEFLFVPINNAGEPSTNPFTGEVRRYDVTDSSFPHDTFVPPSVQGGPLGEPWYLTFGNTDPRTLQYHD